MPEKINLLEAQRASVSVIEQEVSVNEVRTLAWLERHQKNMSADLAFELDKFSNRCVEAMQTIIEGKFLADKIITEIETEGKLLIYKLQSLRKDSNDKESGKKRPGENKEPYLN